MKMRVEYIKRPYKDKVYTYPFLVSSYRDENGKPQRKVHQSLSHLPESAVKALDRSLRGEDNSLEQVSLDQIHLKSAISFGDTWAALSVAKDLRITKFLDLLPREHRTPILAMILDRVVSLKPHSKRALCDGFQESSLNRILDFEDIPPLHEWYNALESLYDKQDEIETALFESGSKRIFLYDVTSSYFEGKCCELAYYGYNRDQKKGKLQIVIGLLCNEDGRPVAVKVFEGNTKDETTVLDQVKSLKEKFGIEEIVIVGDRGMITNKRIEDLEQEECSWVKYITALRRSDMMKFVEDSAHPIQLGLFDEKNLTEVVQDGKRYVLCHNPLRKNQDREQRKKLLEKTEEKLRGIAKNVRDGRLKNKDKIAQRLYRWINRWKMERFFTVTFDEGQFEWKRNEAEIERYCILDGCYVIVTNLDADEMETKEVRDRYKSLAQVEKAFRTMKTTKVEIRPIRHWNAKRVKGHVFVCMLAYLIIWEVRNRLFDLLERDKKTRECEGGSLRELWEELRKIKIGTMDCGGILLQDLTEISSYQKKILKKLKATVNQKARKRLGICRQKK